MKINMVSNTSFDGKFIDPTICKKSHKTKALYKEIKNYNSDLIQKMPFDVTVTCPNPTKKAINPRLYFYIEKEGTYNTFYGNIRVSIKDKAPQEKVQNFITNFAEKFEEKNKKPIKESPDYFLNFIGKFFKKKS